VSTYVCEHQRRLQAVRLAGTANGIEYLEVRDTDETDPARRALRQRTLLVRLLLPVPAALGAGNVVIDGGDRIAQVAATWASAATALPPSMPAAERASVLAGLEEPERVLVVRTAARGDFFAYRLALVAAPGQDRPPAGFDPVLAQLRFSFTVECPADFDCRQPCRCPAGVHHPPAIDYLVKDYEGFRRLLADRVASLVPGWSAATAADAGVTLVELLAYAADELSYRQDAVATEAYLDTARSRISLRRHARLVDYRVHDGGNARAWVQVQVADPVVQLPAGTPVLSKVPGLPPVLSPTGAQRAAAMDAGPVVFETVEDAVLHAGLDALRFWTWGQADCCLPAGATTATLRGHWPQLRAGEVLVLAETVSPATGDPADADPARRALVRLTGVDLATDPSGTLFPGGTSQVTQIRWHGDDALPFALCLSVGDTETAQAWGNLVLADHGLTVRDEDLGAVPAPHLQRVGDCSTEPVPARYAPVLRQRPVSNVLAAPAEPLIEAPAAPALTAELAAGASGNALQALFAAAGLVLPDGCAVRGAAPLWSVHTAADAWQLRERAGRLQVLPAAPPACATVRADPRAARPAVEVHGLLGTTGTTWSAAPDLLASPGTAPAFTVETEHDGTAELRFGDGEHGLRPATGTSFTATYRIGNGTAGNVGRDALAHLVTAAGGIVAVRNPLPAAGGVEPESGDEIRRDAPAAFSVQERAVTAADYAEVALRSRAVERAAATFRWTGSWRTVFVTADRFGNAPVDAAFRGSLRGWLERYRMAGYDVAVDAPVFVPVELALFVCVLPGHFRSDVARAVRAALTGAGATGAATGAASPLFHPDRLTFGQPVHLSAVLAAVHAVAGVQSVQVRRFQRQRQPATNGIAAGVLPMGRLEIARLDDDPNHPERGVLDLDFGGGA
jgi:hypothetical protein